MSFPRRPSAKMRVLLALAFVCLLGVVTAQDPCAFPADSDYTSVWVTSRANVLACFNSVGFSSANRASLVRVLNTTWGGYSFADYVSQPIAPYNVQVRSHPLSKTLTPVSGSISIFCHRHSIPHRKVPRN